MKKHIIKIWEYADVSQEIHFHNKKIHFFSFPNIVVYTLNTNKIEYYELSYIKYVQMITVFGNTIVCACTPNSIFEINQNTKNVSKIQQSVSRHFLSDKEKIIGIKDFDTKANEQTFTIYDLNSKTEVIFARMRGLPFFHDEVIFHSIDSRLDRYSINGDRIYSIPLDFLEKAVYYRGNFFGVYKKIATLQISENYLIGIHIESGSIVWHITNFNVKRYQLDENDGKLKGLVSNSYFEIDVVTGDKKRFNLISHEEYIKNEMKTYDGPAIDSYRDNFVIVGDHIITTDSKSGLFGAFNTKTLKFDWWHEEPNVYFPAARPIRYFDSLLFLLDHRDTLHIYKIEDFSL